MALTPDVQHANVYPNKAEAIANADRVFNVLGVWTRPVAVVIEGQGPKEARVALAPQQPVEASA